jgi:exonuclease SbcD
MKLIHLSNLHIGKRVNEISMIDDQKYILLKQILPIIDDERPDAVLIAGDVYDKTVPSAEAVTLFDEFLYELAQRKVAVLIISGNHDSPERLAFAGRLLSDKGIHISPVYDGTTGPVILSDAHGDVAFWLLPFVKPSHVRHCFAEEPIETCTDAIRVALAHMDVDPTGRNVLLAHQFVTGASTCDSEELSVGTAENVDKSVFEAFDYVALGHIHGPQKVDGNRIRYCGSPLKYSFSEAHHHKSVTVVELGAKGERTLRLIPLMPMHDLREIRGTFAEVTDRRFYANTVTDDYLHIILTDEEDVPEAPGRLRVIYPNMMKLSYDNTRTRADEVCADLPDAERTSPLELFDRLYKHINGQSMSDVQQNYIAELLESLKEANT